MDFSNCFQKLVCLKKDPLVKPWEDLPSQDILMKSICFPIEVNKRFFVISTNHSTFGTYNDFILNDEISYQLTGKKYNIHEIDLCIFEESEKLNRITNTFKIDDINELNIDLEIITNDIFEFIIPFNENFLSLNCKIEKFTKIKYNNFCFPEMPVLIGKLTNESIDKLKKYNTIIEGGSGTPIFKNNVLYGFLSGYFESINLIIIPIFMVKRILQEILISNSFNGLCKSYFELDNLNSKTYIKSIENINCNLNLESKIKSNKLKKKDIILELDDKKICNNMIYDNNLKNYIDIDSYIIINKTTNDINKYLILRPNNKKKKIFEIINGNKSIYSSTNINFNSERINYHILNNKYIYAEICPILFELLLNYRSYYVLNKIYLLTYSKFKNNRFAILCDTLDNSYSIFNNTTNCVDIKNMNKLENDCSKKSDIVVKLKCLKL